MRAGLTVVCTLLLSLLTEYCPVELAAVKSHGSTEAMQTQKKRRKKKKKKPVATPTPSPATEGAPAPNKTNPSGAPLKLYPQPSVGNETSGPPETASIVPAGTDLKIQLKDMLSTRDSKVGDKFAATVLDPTGFYSATITGHVNAIKKPAPGQGLTAMELAFDSIELRDGRKGALRGYITRVYPPGAIGSEGSSKTGHRDSIGTAVGAIIGGIAGGARYGSAIPDGEAGVLYSRDELKLEPGTELIVHVPGPVQRKERPERKK